MMSKDWVGSGLDQTEKWFLKNSRTEYQIEHSWFLVQSWFGLSVLLVQTDFCTPLIYYGQRRGNGGKFLAVMFLPCCRIISRREISSS